MRFISFPSLLLGCSLLFVLPSPKTSKVTVDVVFKNIVEGYDHKTKNEIWIDDNREDAVWSSVTLESQHNKTTLSVPRGKHVVHLVNYAQYEGKWEAHNADNNYSIDAEFNEEMNVNKKKHSINAVFDIDSEKASIKVK